MARRAERRIWGLVVAWDGVMASKSWISGNHVELTSYHHPFSLLDTMRTYQRSKCLEYKLRSALFIKCCRFLNKVNMFGRTPHSWCSISTHESLACQNTISGALAVYENTNSIEITKRYYGDWIAFVIGYWLFSNMMAIYIGRCASMTNIVRFLADVEWSINNTKWSFESNITIYYILSFCFPSLYRTQLT
jgi:hypothetical protein